MKEKKNKISMAAAVESVESSASSIFSKQDVLDLLARIEMVGTLDKARREAIADKLVDYLQNAGTDLLDSYFLEMSGNEVYIDSFEICETVVIDAVEEAFK